MEPVPDPGVRRARPAGPALEVPFAGLLGLTGITSADISACITQGIRLGSGDRLLGWSDFTFSVAHGSVLEDAPTVTQLFVAGMPILDAIVWVWGADRPGDLAIAIRDEDDDDGLTPTETTRALFCWYFSVYSQGRSVPQGAPNFLVNVLGLGEDFADLLRGLTSANLNQFPIEWVTDVQIPTLSEKTRNRLALDAAGHHNRYLTAISYIADDDYIDIEAPGVQYLKALLAWTQGLVWWDLHPVTKSGQVITVKGSLNKNIQSAMHACVQPERLLVLAAAKVIHEVPRDWPTHNKWRQGAPDHLPALTRPIFPA